MRSGRSAGRAAARTGDQTRAGDARAGGARQARARRARRRVAVHRTLRHRAAERHRPARRYERNVGQAFPAGVCRILRSLGRRQRARVLLLRSRARGGEYLAPDRADLRRDRLDRAHVPPASPAHGEAPRRDAFFFFFFFFPAGAAARASATTPSAIARSDRFPNPSASQRWSSPERTPSTIALPPRPPRRALVEHSAASPARTVPRRSRPRARARQ